jgi:O-acetyl-ADP-ribose deacetylase (regulator of RNase III)
MERLRKCLEAMKKVLVKSQVKELAMPRIGFGLDGFTWADVRQLICLIFLDMDISFIVYSI